MMRSRAVTALVVVIVLGALAQGGLAIVLLERDRAAVEARAAAADRAEERTELILERMGELMDELRDPAEDTGRSDLWARAARMEQLLEDLHHELIDQEHDREG
jgi:uncharacterized membrane protein